MNFIEFITRAALKHKIIRLDGLNETAKEIKAIGRNLNQLTTLCYMGKINCPDLTEMKTEYAKSVLALEEIARRCG